MRPALVPVADFPRTAGGKIDMAALPAPAAASSSLRLRRNGGAAIDTTAPPSPLAEQLMAMMADVLGQPIWEWMTVSMIAAAHSLLAMRLIGRIEAELGQRLSLAALHLTPSPRALAAALTEGAEGGDSPETPEGHTLPDHLVIIQDGTARAPLFGVHVLGRNEEFYRPLAAALGPRSASIWAEHRSVGQPHPHRGARHRKTVSGGNPDPLPQRGRASGGGVSGQLFCL
nr:phosphopantetheine-binding protein [Phaeobacter inhibens]